MKTSPYEPEPIEVMMTDDKPSMVRQKKKSIKVKDVLNMWRIDEEWWRTPVSRLYFLLELENGAQLTVFKDLLHRRWYRQNWM
jgi:hypothetical protein